MSSAAAIAALLEKERGVRKKKPRKPLHEYAPKVAGAAFTTHWGADSTRRNAMCAMTESVILSAGGNAVFVTDVVKGKSQAVIPSAAREGSNNGVAVGAICRHPTKDIYVVCEKTDPTRAAADATEAANAQILATIKDPNAPQINAAAVGAAAGAAAAPRVVLYEYPSHKVVTTLKGGAVQGFSACAFSDDGTLLATVASEPDFTLTIWNWETGAIVLRNKAFGADVMTVAFSPFQEGVLVTSGVGHIKFWTMSETFTGLKLQGAVGKFGRTDISDVAGFVQMPDGKVVSSSESGALLLWEGALVKCELARAVVAADGTTTTMPCHAGAIDVMRLIDKSVVMSAGADGFVRYWSLEAIDLCESSGTDAPVAIECLHEVLVAPGAQIRAMTRTPSGAEWIILDAAGAYRRMPFESAASILAKAPARTALALDAATPAAPQKLLSFASGGLNCVAPLPSSHACVVGGADGALRLIDYVAGVELFHTQFNAGVASVQFLNEPQRRMLLATFADGAVRIVRLARGALEVVCEHRPHTSAVVAAAVDASATRVYTIAAGEDKAAFYFTLDAPSGQLTPVGFCKLPFAPTACEWAPAGDAAFVGSAKGEIIALAPPSGPVTDFEFTASYSAVGYRQKKKPPVKERKKPTMAMDDTNNADMGADELLAAMGGGEQQSSTDEDDLEEDVDVGPWGVRDLRRLPNGHILVALDQPELAYDYALSTRYPDRTTPPPLPPSGLEPIGYVEEPRQNWAYRGCVVHRTAVSLSQKRVIVVCAQGRIFLRDAAKADAAPGLAEQLHDGIGGAATDAALSFDDRVLLSVGDDGLLFVQTTAGATPVGAAEAFNAASLPNVSLSTTPTAIARSIQKQKLYDDEERARDAAMTQKEQLLKKVRQVHAEYHIAVAANESATGGRRMPQEDVALDVAVQPQLEADIDATVTEARLEHAWASAKRVAQLRKLQGAFVDTMQWERFCVRPFEAGRAPVAAFRTPHLTERQLANLQSIQQLLGAASTAPAEAEQHAEPTASPAREFVASMGAVTVAEISAASASPADETATAPHDHNISSKILETTHASAAIRSQLERAEERRRERIARKTGLAELQARNPKHQPEDPKIVASVLRAERHMGDYTLKTSREYTVPDHLRPTAERKAKQLALLEHSANQLRAEFNARLLAFRDVKKALCETMNADRERIGEISAQLKMDFDPAPFALAPDEFLEGEVPPSAEALLQWEAERTKERKRQEALDRAKRGFGADLASAGPDMDDTTAQASAAAAAAKPGGKAAVRGRMPGMAAVMTAKEKFEADLRVRLEGIRRSELEHEEALMRREKLIFEKQRLERRIERSMQSFDASVRELLHERLRLQADLLMADMRVFLLYRELLMLLEFRLRDDALGVRLEECREEKRGVVRRSRTCLDRCEQKAVEIEQLRQQLEGLKREFAQLQSMAPDGPLQKALDRIFYKRIKRRRKDEADLDDDDAPTSSDEDEEPDADANDEYADDGEPDQCPAGIEQDLFEAVLALRERRLDCDESLVDFRRTAAALKSEYEGLITKEGAVDKALKAVENEISQFQHEKQQHLNQLDTVVVLKLSQIQCLEPDRTMPVTVDTPEIIVFRLAGLQRLIRRIGELDLEKQELNEGLAALGAEKSRLMRKKSKRVAELGEWEAKVNEVQLLKFGQPVNLELLENVAVDRETEELKARLKMEEMHWERELGKQSDRLLGMRQLHMQRMAENTAHLKDLGALRSEQYTIEKQLDAGADNVVSKMAGGSQVATAEDRARLRSVIVDQQGDIEALKQEISVLRRKGGYVYTPVVPTGTVLPPHPPSSAPASF